MSVSGNEEHGVPRLSSDTVAGIPIKKRRFLLDISTSSSTPASSPESAGKDLPKKELSKILRESSITDNVGIFTSSSEISLAKESACVDTIEEPQSMSNLPVVEIEAPRCISSGSLVDTEMEVKNLLTENNDSQNDLPKKELSNLLRESSVTDYLDLVTSSTEISLSKESADVDASGESQSMSNLPEIKIEVPICISSGSLVDTGMEVKNLLAEKSDFQGKIGYTEPHLVKKEAVAPNNGKDTDTVSKHKFEGNSELESSVIAESTKLSVRPKEHLFQALAGENIEKPHQMQEKLDHISLNLSLSKGKNIASCQSDSVETKRNDSDMSANRNKWDLNTTMDSWEDSEIDAVACEGAVAGASFGGTVSDKKTLDIMSGKGVSVSSQRDFDHRSNISISSTLDTQQYKSDSSLNLCLSPSYHELAPCEKKLSSPLGLDTGRVFPNTNSPTTIVVPSTPTLTLSSFGRVLPSTNTPTTVAVPSTSRLTLSDKSIVKLEPVDESSIRVLSVTKEKSKMLSDERSLRNESTDFSIKLVNSSTQPLIVSGAIKSELLEDTNKGNDPVVVKSCILQKHSELSTTEEKLPPSCTSSSKVVVDSGFVKNTSDCSMDLQMGDCNEEVPQEASERVRLNVSEMNNTCADQEVKETEVLDGMIDTKGTSDVTVSNEPGEISLMEKRENGDESESVQEPSTYSDATITSQAAAVTLSQGEEESTKVTNSVEKNIVTLHKMEKSANGTEEAKNASSPCNRSRIINLKAVNVSSATCKTRSIPETGTSSRIGREKYADSGMEGDKFYHPRGRERVYNESHHRFSRDRNRDQPYRNFRMNYSRGRGRGSSRPSTNFGDWNDDRDIPQEDYSTRFRTSRPRHHGSDVVDDAELDCDSFIPGLDDRIVGPGRGRRKPILDEDIPKFRNFSSRRRPYVSHRGHQMVRRPTRTFSSPSRCIGEDSSTDIVRGSDKFSRAMDDSIVDPVFTRPQPYDSSDGHFTRVNKNFGSVQSRAAVPRTRSKSPVRSPRQWSSPRRGSPDVFDGHQVLTRRRSATIYRADRLIRSPDRTCFHTDMGFRRHNSPPYLDSRQGYVTTRSVVCNRRSPPGRVVQRNNSRFEILDPRERTDIDEYFESPIRSTRFQDLGGGEGSGDERRRGGAERRRPARSFRAPEGENFNFNDEDAPTRPPYRFCQDEDSEFSGRNNLREREFERRGKNRPGPSAHPPRRMRDDVEDQDGNFTASGKVWHNDEFDDIKVKRTRF